MHLFRFRLRLAVAKWTRGWRSADQLIVLGVGALFFASVSFAGVIIGDVARDMGDAAPAARWFLLGYGSSFLLWATLIEPSRAHTYGDAAWRYVAAPPRTLAILAQLDVSPGASLAAFALCLTMVMAGHGSRAPGFAIMAAAIAAVAVAGWSAIVRRVASLAQHPVWPAVSFLVVLLALSSAMPRDGWNAIESRAALARVLISVEPPHWLAWIPAWWPLALVAEITGRGAPTSGALALGAVGTLLPIGLAAVLPAPRQLGQVRRGSVPPAMRDAVRYVERAFWLRSPRFATAVAIATIFALGGGTVATRTHAPPVAFLAMAPIALLGSAILNNSFGIGHCGAAMAAVSAWPVDAALSARLRMSLWAVACVSLAGGVGAALGGRIDDGVVHASVVATVGALASGAGLLVSVMNPRRVPYHGMMTVTATPLGQGLATLAAAIGVAWLTVVQWASASSPTGGLALGIGGLIAAAGIATRCRTVAAMSWHRYIHRFHARESSS